MARGKNIIGRFVERIYGRDGEHETLYLWRLMLTPSTRWGGLYLHIFHRGDLDEDMHDHPWRFWTFPLVTYKEQVRNLHDGTITECTVRRFRVHFRPAEYAHRVLDLPCTHRDRKIVTLVWHGPKERGWGFWVGSMWIHWREYVYGASR